MAHIQISGRCDRCGRYYEKYDPAPMNDLCSDCEKKPQARIPQARIPWGRIFSRLGRALGLLAIAPFYEAKKRINRK